MSTLYQQNSLANSIWFQGRVNAAMITQAISVLGAAAGSDVAVFTARNKLATAVLASPSSYLTLFAYAIAVNATVAADINTPVQVTAVTAGTPAQITTGTAHGYSTGDIVQIDNAGTPVTGTWAITVLTSTTFTIPVPSAGFATLPANASVTKQPSDADITTAISAVWNAIAGINTRT